MPLKSARGDGPETFLPVFGIHQRSPELNRRPFEKNVAPEGPDPSGKRASRFPPKAAKMAPAVIVSVASLGLSATKVTPTVGTHPKIGGVTPGAANGSAGSHNPNPACLKLPCTVPTNDTEN